MQDLELDATERHSRTDAESCRGLVKVLEAQLILGESTLQSRSPSIPCGRLQPYSEMDFTFDGGCIDQLLDAGSTVEPVHDSCRNTSREEERQEKVSDHIQTCQSFRIRK